MTTTNDLMACAHCALFYRRQDEYAREVCSFVRDGMSAAEPVLVAVPGRRLDLVRGALGETGEAVSFADMAVLGRNPARIIPAVRRFADSRRPRRTRFVGEHVWAGRSAAETAEATRHEALLNVAFAAVPTSILCLYDAGGLGAAVLADARRTHPRVVEDGARRASADYSGTEVARGIGGQPLPAPPPGAQVIAFGKQDLPALRDQVRRRAIGAGISPSRAQDLVAAVQEVAASTVVHAAGAGMVRIWREDTALVCEVGDHGRITDPLAGRHLDSPGDDSGHGLRIAHELCDLVELRSGHWGTATRLHILSGPPEGG
jgi:anti-sigma regulatory factor (Ser/Thr protein kinase)